MKEKRLGELSEPQFEGMMDFVFNERIEEPISPNPDINGDGVVDINDLTLIGKHFGKSTETPPAAPMASTSTP